MTIPSNAPIGHSHVFLGVGHEGKERRIWAVIWLTVVMMAVEIAGGIIFGSLALLADGVHMSTHAAALLIAAMAYRYARNHANDPRFAFGTGKLGDLAGFSSAIILGVVALAIGYEAVARLFSPVAIDFNEAIAVAVVGLLVNVASAWLLSGTESHGHNHGHAHDHEHTEGHEHGIRRLDTGHGMLLVEIFEDNVPARFRLRFQDRQGFQPVPGGGTVTLQLDRPNGAREDFTFRQFDGFIESQQEIAEPHEFTLRVRLPHDGHSHDFTTSFSEDHGHETDGAHDSHGTHRDHNFRAALVHIIADAAVSVLAIAGLVLGKFLGWTFMDPVMGIIGALVIANWGFGLVRDTGGILLDMTADQKLADRLRHAVEKEGDAIADLHVWRLGPGHLGTILSIVSDRPAAAEFYRCRFGRFPTLSHVTIEVRPR